MYDGIVYIQRRVKRRGDNGIPGFVWDPPEPLPADEANRLVAMGPDRARLCDPPAGLRKSRELAEEKQIPETGPATMPGDPPAAISTKTASKKKTKTNGGGGNASSTPSA